MLQIHDRRERALVTAADVLLAGGAALLKPFRRRQFRSPGRILLFRLERIGDLLMTLPAIAAVRSLAPEAMIDLVVGSWNQALARAITSVDHVETLDAAWLARDEGGLGLPALMRRTAVWRRRRYDLAINFEPDIRSNLVLLAAGAAWTAGYRSGGGGAVLDHAIEFDPTSHTTDNALRLVETVLGTTRTPAATPLLSVPDEDRRRARAIVGGAARPIIAVHVSGGRPVKQWEPERFAEVARRLVNTRAATVLLTGSPEDRPLIDRVRQAMPAGSAIDASGAESLLTVAALLMDAELLITGDTGPMHLAAAVGTPIVAVFGPSDPRRYAPRGSLDRIVRVDLPCAPCNRIRLPPARCTGRTPDCLALVTPDQVFEAAAGILDACFPRGQARNASA